MSYTELLKWISFFNSRPIGWREDQRTFLLLKAFGFKGQAEEVFATLKQIKTNQVNKQTPDQAMPKGKFLDKLLSAKGGDGFSLLKDGSNGKIKNKS